MVEGAVKEPISGGKIEQIVGAEFAVAGVSVVADFLHPVAVSDANREVAAPLRRGSNLSPATESFGALADIVHLKRCAKKVTVQLLCVGPCVLALFLALRRRVTSRRWPGSCTRLRFFCDPMRRCNLQGLARRNQRPEHALGRVVLHAGHVIRLLLFQLQPKEKIDFRDGRE